jgi:bacillithiol system protein YtxJ
MLFELRHNEDLDHLLERSETDRVIIFKHSTQCHVSREAYDEFQRFLHNSVRVPCGLVLVIENRAVSDEIESRLGIRHASPQAILIHDRQPVWSASHWSITAEALNEALTQ